MPPSRTLLAVVGLGLHIVGAEVLGRPHLRHLADNGNVPTETNSTDPNVLVPPQSLASSMLWLYFYAITLFISCLATLAATLHMRKLGGVFRSTVQFVTTSFLLCTSIHSLAGGLFYSTLIASMHSWMTEYRKLYADGGSVAERNELFNSAIHALLAPDHHKDGPEAAYLTKLTHDNQPLSNTLSVFLVLENIFFVLSAYWIVLVTRELYKLAQRTHDRGMARERKYIRLYAYGAAFIILAFLLTGLGIVLAHRGYNNAYRVLSILQLAAIIASVLLASGALWLLRRSGRKNEHIHGMLIASPLYRRLKLMMVVCTIFTLPYCLLQISLMSVSASHVDDVPDYIVGILTMMYYLFGAAQALVMGGSQHCFFRLLFPLLPDKIRNAPEFRSFRSTRRHESMYNLNENALPPDVPVFVNTDIESSSALWAQAPQPIIDAAQRIHDDLMRAALPKYHGYEITTAGDAFQLAFHNITEAVEYCLEVQMKLLNAKWPSEIEGLIPATKTLKEYGLKKPQVLFRGLRVRMGIHDTNTEEEGSLVTQVHPVTGKTVYIGASELIGREIADVGYGGEVLVSKRIALWLKANENKPLVLQPYTLDYYGLHEVRAVGLEIELYELTPKALEGRRKVFKKRALEEKQRPKSSSHGSALGSERDDAPLQDQDPESSEPTGDFFPHESPTASAARNHQRAQEWAKV